METDIEFKTKIEISFSSLWKHFAEDFLRDGFSEEYNSIKHGFRLRIGGFSLAMECKTLTEFLLHLKE
jgi:hypothetical protein